MTTELTIARPIVHTEGNRVFATSKDVAAYFEKQHKHVMDAIKELVSIDPSLQPNFRPIEIDTLVGYGWRKFPAYEMDRKGFTMLAFGFTGEKAVKFKSRYIDAFDEAIERLKEFEAKAAPLAAPTTIVEALRVALIEAEKREEAERARAAAEEAARELAGPASVGTIISKTGRSLKEVASLLPHVNMNQTGNDLINAGYLDRDRFTGKLRVVGKHRDILFTPSLVIVRGEARQQITVCEQGYETLAKLYLSGRLTMKKGWEHAWRKETTESVRRHLGLTA